MWWRLQKGLLTFRSMTEVKVLIAGASIAGLASAIALGQLDKPNLKFNIQLYDKATGLREIGASIALSPNGLRTLERLGVHSALDHDVAFRGPSALHMIYRHWKTNDIVSVDQFVNVPDTKHQTARFHRAHLHQALLAHVPSENIHLHKAVKHGETFKPEHTLHYTGRTWIRSTFDASLVENMPDFPADSTHWRGPRYTFFASRLGRNMYSTVGNYDPKDFPAEGENFHWDQEGDVSFFRELYKDWNPVVKALADATPHVRMYSNFAGEPLDSWVFGSRVTSVGDAAHTHGGAHAAGGSLALDDSWALYLLVKHVLASLGPGQMPSVADIQLALTLYEKTRRPHTEQLVRSVLAGVGAAAPTTDAELRERMENRPSMTWLTEHDVEATLAKVLHDQDLIPCDREHHSVPSPSPLPRELRL
ncbi:hypothetical protein PV05_09601 [Exophiala xenobiotica]|uniref:FAD-binding domain-containing protein n=1 Tax=Exophiala xenobiotica TaxID=348802 RepID=A0A0D2ESM7_9EURO|nr:uncharacterized protein PV05_09601 [Exophiala xenobiotica]KIW50814.1 hypothetical protein PV05_09601 [Exophiala xenobiotica]